eukprot:TRINITY_DN1696_c0_g1_i2.p1 TRINITY_DN1696_c0_g1~~TRINITY_DN1696_c0_g1_i2.p1  ORF type:complete len:278 (-),score=48.91 TRINITY_DN1696_c0_g1_i2:178-1011(-)
MPKATEGENDDALHADLTTRALFGVEGKVVLVTGGGSGIGAMIASGFVQQGCRVYIASRKEASDYAAELTRKGPGTCTAMVCDITRPDHQRAALDKIREAEGKLNVLVNNSGTNFSAPLEDYDQEHFSKVMRLNVDAVFALTRLAAPLLETSSTAADPGRVINISSIDGMRVPMLPTFAYSTSKAAVLMLTQHMAAALGEKHITVNAICPGPFRSRMMRATLDAGGDAIAKSTALGRIGEPADMAGACIFLSSKAGSLVTGTDFAVDAGARMGPSRL